MCNLWTDLFLNDILKFGLLQKTSFEEEQIIAPVFKGGGGGTTLQPYIKLSKVK